MPVSERGRMNLSGNTNCYNRIRELRKSLEQKKGKRDQVQEQLYTVKEELKNCKKDYKRHERAGVILKKVALTTQQQLQYHISDIASMALDAIFPDPYELVAEFVQRRNKTECDLLFERKGERVDPLSASGGGAVDVASFALRVASWSMERPRLRNTLILDEPFRYLSAGLLPKASEMLSQLSEDMGLQLIIVTHEEELMEGANKVFTVSQRKGISTVD